MYVICLGCKLSTIYSINLDHQQRRPMAQKYESNKNQLIVVAMLNVCLVPFLVLCLVMSWNPDHFEAGLANLYYMHGLDIVRLEQRYEPHRVRRKVSTISSGIQTHVWLHQNWGTS